MNATVAIEAKNYSTFVARLVGEAPEVRGPWASWGPPSTRPFGWKLHLSTTQIHAAALLSRVLPLLLEAGVGFKCARNEEVLSQLNEGAYGDTQVGKFITIYPQDDEQARRLADAINACTREFVGPVIPSDLRIGPVLYARVGPFAPEYRRDRLGSFSVIAEQAQAELDSAYHVPFVFPEGWGNPFAGLEVPAERLPRLLGPGFLLLEPMYVNAKGSLLRALDLREQSSVAEIVLKEGRRYCLVDSHGRDMRDRIRHQATLHRKLEGRVRVPRVGSCFEACGHAYLPMEIVEGRALVDMFATDFGAARPAQRRDMLELLDGVAAEVEKLHACDVVHRDLSPRNVLVDEQGAPWLIDLELAVDLQREERPFTLGTRGFMSPQQAAREGARLEDDLFGLGALCTFILAHCDPVRLQFGDEAQMGQRLESLAGVPRRLAETIASMHSSRPESRGSVTRLREALRDSVRALEDGTTFELAHERTAPRNFSAWARSALRGLAVSQPTNDSGLWLSLPLDSKGTGANAAPVLYRSASRGVAGPLYAVARLAALGLEDELAGSRCVPAIDWLLALEPTADLELPGLHFGEAGVALAICEAVAAGLCDAGPWLSDYLEFALQGPLDWPDMTHGAAGQLIATLRCHSLLVDAGVTFDFRAAARRCADYLLESQASDGSWRWPAGVEGMEGSMWFGFAHGVAGMAYALIEAGHALDDAELLRAGLEGAQWVWSRRNRGPHGPSWTMREGDDAPWNWFCHGAAGSALTFLAAFARTEDPVWADRARACLASVPARLPIANLSLCHGLAGIGEIFLEASRLLGDREWRDRAERLAEQIWVLRSSEGGASTWLVEGKVGATADLMVGSAGIAHFFGRLAAARDPGMALL